MEKAIICKRCKNFMSLITACGSGGGYSDFLHFQCKNCGSFATWKLSEYENEIKKEIIKTDSQKEQLKPKRRIVKAIGKIMLIVPGIALGILAIGGLYYLVIKYIIDAIKTQTSLLFPIVFVIIVVLLTGMIITVGYQFYESYRDSELPTNKFVGFP